MAEGGASVRLSEEAESADRVVRQGPKLTITFSNGVIAEDFTKGDNMVRMTGTAVAAVKNGIIGQSGRRGTSEGAVFITQWWLLGQSEKWSDLGLDLGLFLEVGLDGGLRERAQFRVTTGGLMSEG